MIDDASKDALLLDLLGGADLLRAADQHYGDGVSLATLAGWTGIPKTTLRRRLRGLRGKLAEHGQLPARWRQHGPGRPAKPVIGSTGGDLHETYRHRSEKWTESE